jgi:hypothetical protein
VLTWPEFVIESQFLGTFIKTEYHFMYISTRLSYICSFLVPWCNSQQNKQLNVMTTYLLQVYRVKINVPYISFEVLFLLFMFCVFWRPICTSLLIKNTTSILTSSPVLTSTPKIQSWYICILTKFLTLAWIVICTFHRHSKDNFT